MIFERWAIGGPTFSVSRQQERSDTPIRLQRYRWAHESLRWRDTLRIKRFPLGVRLCLRASHQVNSRRIVIMADAHSLLPVSASPTNGLHKHSGSKGVPWTGDQIQFLSLAQRYLLFYDRERQISQAHFAPERLISRRSSVVLPRDEWSCYGLECILQSEAKMSWSEIQSTMIGTPLLEPWHVSR